MSINRFKKLALSIFAGGIAEIIIMELIKTVSNYRTPITSNNSTQPGIGGSLYGFVIGLTDLLRPKRATLENESVCLHRLSDIHLTTQSGGHGYEDGAVCILCGETFPRQSFSGAPSSN